jgi:hypothetical protein
MRCQEFRDIQIRKIVGIDDDNIVGICGPVGIGADRARRAEQYRLVGFDRAEAPGVFSTQDNRGPVRAGGAY